MFILCSFVVFFVNLASLWFFLEKLSAEELAAYLSSYDMRRLEMYSNKLVDYHLVMDLLPHIARVFFLGKLPDVKLSIVQQVRVYSRIRLTAVYVVLCKLDPMTS